MRTILVGDIHGCCHHFIKLLKKVHYNKNRDRLILMGDLMDRGPWSHEMLMLAVRWKRENPNRFFMIRGNHEQMIVEQDKSLERQLIWRCVGKGASLRSFRRHKDKMENYIPWILKNMPLAFEDSRFQCVHASIAEDKIKYHSWSKKNLYQGKLTIIGHTPLDEPTYYDGSGCQGLFLEYHQWQPLPEKGAICIDTGCVYGNKLTAMIIEDGNFCLEMVPGTCYFDGSSENYIKYVKKFCHFPQTIRNFYDKI